MPMSAYKRQLRALVGHDLLQTPGVAALIHDASGRLLLQQRGDGLWGLPGGELEPDETPADAIRREIWEEMGVLAEPLRAARRLQRAGVAHRSTPTATRTPIST